MPEPEIIERLERIERLLRRVLREEKLLMADQAALDQAISDLATQASATEDAVNAIIAKLGSIPGAPDFSAEVSSLQTATTGLKTAADDINAAINPPPPAS